MILFDLLKQILTDAVTDTDFVKKNTILQDNVTKQELIDRISKLKRDYPVVKTFADVLSTGPDIPTGSVSIDSLNRRLAVATSGAGTATFDTVTHPPLKLFGWLLSADTTMLPADMQVQYRFSSTDSWKILNQIDHVDNVTALQLRINVPGAIGVAANIKSLIILAEQI